MTRRALSCSLREVERCEQVRQILGMRADCVASADFAEITALLDRAFAPSTFESSLMLALRGSGREVLEWVLRSNGRIAAHSAFTRAYRERSAIGFHLAPVAVHPEFQRRGFGTA